MSGPLNVPGAFPEARTHCARLLRNMRRQNVALGLGLDRAGIISYCAEAARRLALSEPHSLTAFHYVCAYVALRDWRGKT